MVGVGRDARAPTPIQSLGAVLRDHGVNCFKANTTAVRIIADANGFVRNFFAKLAMTTRRSATKFSLLSSTLEDK